MNKNYNLKLDLKFKRHNSKMKFDEFDKNTSDFYIHLTKDNKSIEIDNAILTLVAIKPDKSIETQFAEIKDNSIYCNLKDSMKDVVGEYECKAMLTLKDKVIVVDQSIFYTVDENKLLRALNKEVENVERFTILTDMINRLSDIENNENTRITNENDRLLLQETLENLIEEVEKAEIDRQEHEVARERTHQKLKEEIKKSKTINTNTEATNKIAKELITSVNLTHEDMKKTNKDTKVVLESTREIENEARKNEEARQKLYNNTQITLKEFKNSEVTRENNEKIRIKSEEARELKISNVETRYNNLIDDVEALINELSELDSYVENNEINRVEAEKLRKQKYDEFEIQYNSLIDEIQSQLEDTNEVKADLISKVNEAKEKMIKKANDTVAKANESIDNVNAMSNKANETNAKVNEALLEANSVINDVNNTKDNIVNQFNALSPDQQSNVEVQLARTDLTGKTHSSLHERLIADNKMQSMLFEDVEGSYITSESIPSNIQQVEILGNTYQDPNTFEITSLGTEIEGTDSVKIDISSCNKNLFDGEYKIGYAIGIEPNYHFGQYYTSADYSASSNFIKVKPNTRYKGNKARAYVIEYDAMYNPIRLSGSYTEFTMSTNAKYIKFYIPNADKEGFMIEESTISTATSYVEHGEDNKEIILPHKLNGFEGSRDRLFYDGTEWVIEKNTIIENVENLFTGFYILKGTNVDGLVIEPKLQNIILDKNTFLIEGIEQDPKAWVNESVGKFYVNPSNFVLVIPKNESLNDAKNRILGKISIACLSEPQIIKTCITDPNLLNLRTFEPKTHIYFGENTGAEGTIKCKVSKSLGASVSSNTKSIEGVKQELDNVKNLVDTVGTMKISTENGFVSIDNTIDGYIDDVEIRGKSLVNLSEVNEVTLSFNNKGAVTNAKNIIKPNTTYTQIVNILENTLDREDSTDPGVGALNETGMNCLFPLRYIEKGFKGLIITKTITPSIILPEHNFSQIRTYTITTTGSITVQELILEGDYTENPPEFFEGLMSVGQDKEIEVLTCNENIVNLKIEPQTKNGITFSYDEGTQEIVLNGTCTSDNTTSYVVKPPKVVEGNTYYCKLFLKQELLPSQRMYFRVHDKNWNKGFQIIMNNELNTSYTSNDSFEAVNTGLRIEANSTFNDFRIKAVLSTVPISDYIPYQDNKRTLLKPVLNDDVTTYEPIVLRGINDNVYDSVVSNKLIERCGEVTLDGSHTILALMISENTIRVSYTANAIIPNRINFSSPGYALCDRLRIAPIWNIDEEGTYADTQLVIRLNKSKIGNVINNTTVSEYLKNNPITIVYQLAEPVITELPYDLNLRAYSKQTNFIVDGGAIKPPIKFNIKNSLANTVKGIMNKVQKLENDYISNAIKQNKLALRNTYNSDSLNFDIQVMTNRSVENIEIDYDVYNLIKENIEVGKGNYDREQIETIIDFYIMIFKISFEMGMELFDLIEQQYNPHVEDVIEGECEVIE